MTIKTGIVRATTELREQIGFYRKQGLRIGFVPTMGALHEGHLSLVTKALEHSDRVIVSIFVNPTQFAPGEDYERYPRQEDEDCRKLEQSGAHLVFIPAVEEMYPKGHSTTVNVGGITSRLEGAHRPGHFEGVATVVTRLLLQCLPDVAVFGEKDFQQLSVIRRLVSDLSVPVEIIGAPIVRDSHGLALSSRNAYLTEESLASARQLNKILFRLAASISASPKDVSRLCDQAKSAIINAGFQSVDYLELIDPDTFEKLEAADRPSRLVVTARIQGVRLLDNLAVLI